MFVPLSIFAFFLYSTVLPELGNCLKVASFHKQEGKYLPGRVIQTKRTDSEFECTSYCTIKESCLSVNYQHTGDGKGLCELNDEALSESPEDGLAQPEFSYLGVVQRNCEDVEKVFSPRTKKCVALGTCKQILEKARSFLDNGVYKLQRDDVSQQYPVYCHMTDITECGGAGWTLVMKTDGRKQTFNYSASYWSDKETYQVQEGLEGLTEKESKLASYWNTPFTKICLGMKVNGVSKWIKLDYEASSLYSVIAGGTIRKTTVGRGTWKSLISGSSLQTHCNKEGFNIQEYNGEIMTISVRLGIIANEQNDCFTCDSYIAFGVSFFGGDLSAPVTGNLAKYSPDNGEKNTPAFGYILVQ